MASEETEMEVTVDLRILGQPNCCNRMVSDGWKFEWDKATAFVSAIHSKGGRMSMVNVYQLGLTPSEQNQIGIAIAMLLNGGTA